MEEKLNTKQRLKKSIKDFPVTMVMILIVTFTWPLLMWVTGDTNLIIIGICLLFAFSTLVVEAIFEKRNFLHYLICAICCALGLWTCYTIFNVVGIYLVVGLILIFIFRYGKSDKTLGKYMFSILKFIIFIIFIIFTVIVLTGIIFLLCYGFSTFTINYEFITMIFFIYIGVLLLGLVIMPKLLCKISEL